MDEKPPGESDPRNDRCPPPQDPEQAAQYPAVYTSFSLLHRSSSLLCRILHSDNFMNEIKDQRTGTELKMSTVAEDNNTPRTIRIKEFIQYNVYSVVYRQHNVPHARIYNVRDLGVYITRD